MAEPDSRSLWRRAAWEVLLGRRGLPKAVHLALPLAAGASAGSAIPSERLWIACLGALLIVACWIDVAILANDIADSEADAAAGKDRWLGQLPSGARWLLPAAFGGLGGAVALLAGGPAVLAAYLAAVALALAYSLAPVRLKGRGAAGLPAYPASAATALAVLPWAWLRFDPALLAVVGAAVALDKWVNLHFHQVVDYEADLAAGTRTYAVAVGRERARRTLRWAASAAAVWLGATAAFVALRLPSGGLIAAISTAGVALAAGFHVVVTRRRAGAPTAVVRELPSCYLALTLAVFRVLPLVLLARLTWRIPSMGVVLAAFAGLVALDAWYGLRYRHG